jgi:hypothetical protein
MYKFTPHVDSHRVQLADSTEWGRIRVSETDFRCEPGAHAWRRNLAAEMSELLTVL